MSDEIMGPQGGATSEQPALFDLGLRATNDEPPEVRARRLNRERQRWFRRQHRAYVYAAAASEWATRTLTSCSAGDAVTLCNAVPVLHMHGQLGLYEWMLPAGTDGALAYGATNSPQTAATSARLIQIITDDIPADRLKQAREWLAWARRVCFLGFGYHPMNVERLKVHKLGDPNKTVAGTAFGMPTGERDEARSRFPKIELHNCDVLSFLCETPFIHG